jgi:fibronectin type 3 domain-containing protein
VTFAPAAAGNATGNVTVSSNATNSPASIALSGSGVQPVQHSATLSWNASTSTVVGYHAYRGTISGGPYTKLTSSANVSTTFTDSTVQSGQTYYYVVTAIDSSGVESVNSNQVPSTIPTP